MELRVPLPDNPTIEDIAIQMRADHECRDIQHEETNNKLNSNNLKTMLAATSLMVAIVGGGFTTIKVIANIAHYVYQINEKIDELLITNKNQDEELNHIGKEVFRNTNRIDSLQSTVAANTKRIYNK